MMGLSVISVPLYAGHWHCVDGINVGNGLFSSQKFACAREARFFTKLKH